MILAQLVVVKFIYSINWKGTNSSSDYYNGCAINTPVKLPLNGVEFQNPKTGEACSGIFMLHTIGSNQREYVQASLNESLNENYYRIIFYVLLQNISSIAVNNFGVFFSNFEFSTNEQSEGNMIAPFTPQFVSFTNSAISDSLNWTKIEGIYKAIGNENYITIGNFSDDNNTKIKFLKEDVFTYPAAYYYIDDVSVEEITEPFWQYRDTLVHYGDSVLIGPAITGLDIDWYTADMQFLGNAPGIYVSPETSRSYIAKERFNGNETTHTVFVTVLGGAGIIENKLEHVAIYPNPSTASFFVVGKNLHEEITLTLSDLNGKVVHSEQRFFSGQDEKVEFDVKAGVYFLHLKSTGAHEVVRKIVVR
jgi:hypothetical protein